MGNQCCLAGNYVFEIYFLQYGARGLLSKRGLQGLKLLSSSVGSCSRRLEAPTRSNPLAKINMDFQYFSDNDKLSHLLNVSCGVPEATHIVCSYLKQLYNMNESLGGGIGKSVSLRS